MSFGSRTCWGWNLGPMTSFPSRCWLLLLFFKNLLSSVLKFPASQTHVNIRSDTAVQLGSPWSWWLRMTEINTLCSTGARSHRLRSPSPPRPGPSSFFPSPGSFPVVLCSLMYPSLRFLPVLLNIPCLGETFQQLSCSKRTRAGIQGTEYTDRSGDPDLETGSGRRSITWEVSSLAVLPLQGGGW